MARLKMRLEARWVAVLLLVLALAPAPAEARPTVSGTLVAYNPGARRLQIRRADGVVKSVVLTQNAKFEIYGNHVSPAQFRQGMQVAVRVVGALSDDPLEADLLTDIGSSSRYVSTSATSPYSTPTGNYATGAGAGGVSPGLPQLGGPSVLGPLGYGGNFPGSLTNPGQPIPQNNSAFPQMIPGSEQTITGIPPQPQAQGAGMPAQPAPLGSPFTGQVVSQQPGVTPTAPAPNPYAPAPAPAAAPYGAPAASPYGASPYGTPASPYGAAPGSNASLIDGGDAQGQGQGPSAMFAGQDDDDDEGGGGFGSGQGPMGMQVLQFQGRIYSVDPYNRVLTVVPAGAAYTLQVSLPAGVYAVAAGTNQAVPLESLRPGQGVQVHGLKNAAGIVEARALSITP